MDIRKFFGGASGTKTSEKSSDPTSKNADSKNSEAHKITKTAKKSPRSPAKSSTKERKSSVTSPTKVKIEPKKAPKQTVVELEHSDSEDFARKDAKKELDVKMKENRMTGNKETSKMSAKEADETKRKEKHDVILPNDEDGHNNNNTSKSKSDPVKKRKREPVLVSESEEDEAPIAKRKPASKTKHKAVIYDSESDEDPLPKNLRDKSPVRKASRKRNIDLDSDNSPAPIREAMSKIQPKVAKKSEQPAATASVVKKPVDVNDFFGVTPIHRTESRQPGKVNGSKVVPDSSKSVQEDKDIDKHAKKIKLDESSTEVEHHPPGSGVRLSEKLAAKKKVAEESLPSSEDKQSKLQAKTKPDVVSKSPQKASPEKSKPRVLAANTPTSAKKSPGEASEKGSMQKKGSAFLAFKNREPPKALGLKEIPEGAENCLEGLSFVITGVLESIERDDAKSLVERYGGKVMANVSKNTKYLVIGRDPGEAKTSKAKQLGIKQFDEDGLFDLIRTLPGKKSKYEIAAAKEAATHKTPLRSSSSAKPRTPSTGAPQTSSGLTGRTPDTQSSEAVAQSSQKTLSPEFCADSNETLMWVDRYKPTNSKQIIGQQGDKSNAKKLLNWLTAWHKNLGKKPVFGRTGDDGAGHKAALLSGPPGVGKTTTAQIICQEAGFSYVELNASDTRSKRSLKEEVAEALNNHTLVDFFGQNGSKTGAHAVDGQRHCLIMDEVDGMAGNEDRGGMQELILLIKQTKIPVICMCNDRNHQKVRSLSNYCFDLRFQRPRIEQIKGAMMSIAFREGLKIPAPALNDIILAANQDIRQVLHNLSMWTVKDKTLTYEQLKLEAKKAQKDLHLGPFDVCRKVFAGGEETNKMTLNDKSDLFFHDYSIGPLFVQENYIHVTPFSAQGSVRKHLRCLSRAADSIAAGDLVDAHVRRGQNWYLLPTQAMFASVIPGESMRGSIGQMVQFPSWLGKNSTTSKNDRLHQELRTHMRLNISADKRALGQDYLPALRLMLTSPLINDGTDGVSKVVSLLDTYDLLREDFDSVIELTSWSGMKDPMSQVDSKVKAAFTRAYNKEVHLTPYATGAAAKKGRGRGGSAAGQEDYELELREDEVVAGEESEHEDNDDVTADTMIKAKKAPTKPSKPSKSTSSQDQSQGTSRGKGKGKGKATKKSN